MALETWEYALYGAGIFYGGVYGLVLVPIYCWFTLFFSIPLAIVDLYLAYDFASAINYNFTNPNNYSYLHFFWYCVGYLISIPITMFMAIFGNIILIPSFIIGVPIGIVVFVITLSLISLLVLGALIFIK